MICKLPQVAQVNNMARVDTCHLKYVSSFLHPAFHNQQIPCNPEGLVVGFQSHGGLFKHIIMPKESAVSQSQPILKKK